MTDKFDFQKEDQPEWNWVPHGDGWALMQGRCSRQHGLNKLTVATDGFDWGGDAMRTLIARLLNEHTEAQRSPQKPFIERLASMLHEPMELPEGCPSIEERIVGAIDMLYRERKAASDGEHDWILLIRAWAPVVRSALGQAAFARGMAPPSPQSTGAEWEAQCRETEHAADLLTADQRGAADRSG